MLNKINDISTEVDSDSLKRNKFTKIQNLFFSREDQYLFRDFSLEIFEGEWLSLRGKNGAGKSTLLKLIAGHISPDSGDIWTIPYAYLGHQNGQRPYLTVFQQLRSKRELAGELSDCTPSLNEILSRCALNHIKDEPIGKLSAGQQRKVALAELFFTPKKLWLLDEPLAHLDRESEKIFESLFQEHIQSGGCILQADHTSYPDSYNVREVWLGKNYELTASCKAAPIIMEEQIIRASKTK